MKKIHFKVCILILFIFFISLKAQLPIELTGKDRNISSISNIEKEVYSDVQKVLKVVGDGKNTASVIKAIDGLGKIIKQHSDYSDAYYLRAIVMFQMQKSKKYDQIISDINNSIKHQTSKIYKSAYESDADKYSMLAKVYKEMGKDSLVVEYLEKALYLGKSNPTTIFSVSNTRAEEYSESNLWNLIDFNNIIDKNPYDFRGYFFRGLYYYAFITYNQKYFSLSEADFDKGNSIDSSSALFHYFYAILWQRYSFWSERVWKDLSGQARDEYNTKVVDELNKTIQLNPQFKEAYLDRATAKLSLKQYEEAIEDYNKYLELDPENANAYNDRGLSYFNLGKYYNAIFDYDKAIEIKTARTE